MCVIRRPVNLSAQASGESTSSMIVVHECSWEVEFMAGCNRVGIERSLFLVYTVMGMGLGQETFCQSGMGQEF